MTKQITLSDLKPFQKHAGGALASMILEYPNGSIKPRYDSDTGERLPFLCRLKAITGAGKTPILAFAASLIKDGIILWTTNRGAVVSQTWSNLQQDGKYGQLLPADTSVYNLSDMSDSDWESTLDAPKGLTILLATVASFNQQGETLKVHQKQGNLSRWEMLGNSSFEGRKRSLYIFYDEGHGATPNQFDHLRKLKPKAFVLASASPLPEDLMDLLSGKTTEERQKSLQERTIPVPTREVVEAGLLKRQLYFMDCDTNQFDAVREAHLKWQELESKLLPYNQKPIVCFIVNETTRGIDIWENLVKLGVSKSDIAVHLNGARDVILERLGSTYGMLDTYTGKKTADRSPESLRTRGFTHIIWNMTLREGWDEPLAYVAYVDDRGRSTTDIVQKIGRFVRQPNATSFDDPDLNAAYFYFQISDEGFTSLIRQTQTEMETDGYEVLSLKNTKIPVSRTSPAVKPATVPQIKPWFGPDVHQRDQIIIENVPLFAQEALEANGVIKTRVISMTQLAEDENQRREVRRESNEVITPWKYLAARLARVDSRLVDDRGNIFSPDLQTDKRMKQEMQYGSEAMRTIDKSVKTIREQLEELIQLVDEGKYDVFTVPPFKLTSPDVTGVSELQQEKYKVRRYQNAVHTEYNGLNSFEVQVAQTLDTLGKLWCRNPSTLDGYKIPIPVLGSDSIWFYPDFLLWTDSGIWAIDPKGKHLIEAAVINKLLDLSNVNNMTTPIQIAFILEGRYEDSNQRWSKTPGRDGYTLIRRTSSGVRSKHSSNLESLILELVDA